jgi:hypothetical protein
VSTNFLKQYHFNKYYLIAENEIGTAEITFVLHQFSDGLNSSFSANMPDFLHGQMPLNQGKASSC